MKKHRALPTPTILLFLLFSLVFVDYAINLSYRTGAVGKFLGVFTRPLAQGLQQLEHRYYDLQSRKGYSSEIAEANRELRRAVDGKKIELFSQDFNQKHDHLMKMNRSSQDIAIVAIDEKTLSELDQWPLRRDNYAYLLEKVLGEGNARAMVFDVGFFEKGNQDLTQTLQTLQQTLPSEYGPKLQQMFEAANANLQLEEAFAKFKRQIVAGSIMLSSAQASVKSEKVVVFPEAAVRYPLASMDPPLIGPLTKRYASGAFSYPDLRKHSIHNAYFTVSPDRDGIVRHMRLIQGIPARLRSEDSSLSETQTMLFAGLGLEAYNVLQGSAIRSPRKLNKNLIGMDASSAFPQLKDSGLEELRAGLIDYLQSLGELDPTAKKALLEIAQTTPIRFLGAHETLPKELFLCLSGDYEGEGFFRQMDSMLKEIFLDFIARLEPQVQSQLLEARNEGTLNEFTKELAPLSEDPKKRLFSMLAKSLWFSIVHQLNPLHAFSIEDREAMRNVFFSHTHKLNKYVGPIFEAESNFTTAEKLIRMEPDGRIGITFKGPKQSYIQYSMADVLNRDSFRGKLFDFPTAKMTLKEAFEGRIVFLGPTAMGINDWRPTPIAEYMDGVELHCHTLDSLRDESQVLRPNGSGRISFNETLVVLFALFGVPFLLLRLNALFGALLTLGLAGGWLYFCETMFHYQHIYYQATPVVAALAYAYIFLTTHEYIMEEKEKAKTRDAFSRYVNKSVVDSVLNDPDMLKLEGQRREMTVLFSDVRGFTTISEKLEPEVLVEVMNLYLTEMTTILLDYDGTLDKFIGDAVMAFWGAPLNQEDHARRATVTAIEMDKATRRLAVDVMEKYGVELAVGIGLNTGPMIVGNVGSAERFNYTVLGDAVNLGARLEAQTKNYGAFLILNESTYEIVKDWVAGRFLDLIAVKGKAEPVRIFEVIGYRKEQDKQTMEGLKAFDDAVAEYYYPGRNFAAGIEAFEKLKIYRGGQDKACDLYVERCREFAENPPPQDWKGVFVATSK